MHKYYFTNENGDIIYLNSKQAGLEKYYISWRTDRIGKERICYLLNKDFCKKNRNKSVTLFCPFIYLYLNKQLTSERTLFTDDKSFAIQTHGNLRVISSKEKTSSLKNGNVVGDSNIYIDFYKEIQRVDKSA